MIRYSTVTKVLIIGLISISHLLVAQKKSTYENQKAFVDMRFGMFIHFSIGTFTGEEWAKPNQDPKLFAPPVVNCDQWATAAKAAGMKFAVLTTKHHDGFALWPTKFGKKNNFGTYQNVMFSGYKQDIVKQYMDAFRKVGVTPCLYFSIWDRTEGIDDTHFTQDKLNVITGQLTELLTNYGDIPFLVFDGWTWLMGRNKISYQIIRETVKKLQPNCLITDHNGLTQPFEVDVLNFEHFNVPNGNTYASTQENPIMPAWFWHDGYSTMDPLNLNSLLNRLANAEANYCNFLLDCPPNKLGVLDDNVVTRLKEAGAKWKPNLSRTVLPDPKVLLEHPVTPVSAAATSNTSTAHNAIDGISDWVKGAAAQTLWLSSTPPSPASPQSVTLDFGQIYNNIELLEYMPSQERTIGNDITTVNTQGHITAYNIFISTDNKIYKNIASGTWTASGVIKKVQFTPMNARYIRLEATGTAGGKPMIVSEIDAGGVTNIPTPVNITTGMQDTELPAGTVSCYPNPFNTFFQINFEGNFKYTLFDMSGLIVETGISDNHASVGNNMKMGMYILKIENSLSTKTFKITKK